MPVKKLQCTIIPPYEGKLVILLVPEEKYLEQREEALHLPKVEISIRSQFDLELLAVGAFSPLEMKRL